VDRVRLALTNVLRDADTPPFTASFGIARTAEGTLFVDVLACADESLLRAKKGGRNQTIISPELLPARHPVTVEGDEPLAGQQDDLSSCAAAA
jgi:hypothetical protein